MIWNSEHMSTSLPKEAGTKALSEFYLTTDTIQENHRQATLTSGTFSIMQRFQQVHLQSAKWKLVIVGHDSSQSLLGSEHSQTLSHRTQHFSDVAIHSILFVASTAEIGGRNGPECAQMNDSSPCHAQHPCLNRSRHPAAPERVCKKNQDFYSSHRYM